MDIYTYIKINVVSKHIINKTKLNDFTSLYINLYTKKCLIINYIVDTTI